MRTAFIKELLRLAEQDPRIVFITGDLGYSVIEEFASRLPDQFVNVGVAEQNMTGIAAGMASTGKKVFTYSIANFPTIRCLEQVRNDVCYHGLDVTIVSIGGGLAYGALGYSHHAIEDLAIMRALPNMTVVAPGDPLEAAAATIALTARGGPAYLRLGKAGEKICHEGPPGFEIGKAIQMRPGNDLTIVSTGGVLPMALDAADLLAASGFRARVLSMHTVKPLDTEALEAAAEQTAAIVTIEEHSLIGGLGGAVAEVLSEKPRVPIKRFGLPSECVTDVGSQDYLRARAGLTSDVIAAATVDFVTALKVAR